MAEVMEVKVTIVDGNPKDPASKNQPNTQGGEDAKNAEQALAANLAKQAAGFIPGANQIMSTVSNIAGTAATVGKTFASSAWAGYAAIAIIALQLAKKAYDEIKEYKKQQRQSHELRRRAGFEGAYSKRSV